MKIAYILFAKELLSQAPIARIKNNNQCIASYNLILCIRIYLQPLSCMYEDVFHLMYFTTAL